MIRVVPLIAAAILSGCVNGSPRAPEAALPPAFEAQAGSAMQQIDRWWLLYGDAQLVALIEEALERGFSTREAFARLEEARAVRQSALNQYDVQGNIEASAQGQQTYIIDGAAGAALGGTGGGTGGQIGGGGAGFVLPGFNQSYALSLPVSWELDLFGRRAAARRSADAELQASGFAYFGARAALAADVASQLFQARGLAVQIADARESVRVSERSRDLTARSATAGLVARSDVDRVDTDLANAQAQLAGLEAQLFVARRSLLALLGRAGAALDSVPIAAADLDAPPPPPAAIPADLLVRRPDVLEQRARIDAALGRLRGAELAQFPTITLSGSGGLNAQRGAFDITSGFWSIGSSLLVPVLNRGRLRAEVRAEDARTEQAVLAFERVVQQAFSETDQALAQLAADRRRVTVLVEGEARARASYDAATIRFQRGLSGLQTLLDAETAWRVARNGVTQARVDALSRSVQLFKALGGGWSPQPLQTTRGTK